MLGWTGDDLCFRASIAGDVLTRAEAVDGPPSITHYQAILVQQAFQHAGVRFSHNGAVLRSMIAEGHP